MLTHDSMNHECQNGYVITKLVIKENSVLLLTII